MGSRTRVMKIVYGEQDKSDENRLKCLVVSLMFPHPSYMRSLIIIADFRWFDVK